jgi:glycosyltransferase involved in cell wall biosynthesis
MAPAPVTVVILTFNEERNLEACLASLRDWAGEVFVVDSGSTDRTRELAEAGGARVVTHAFETHAKQWNWALRELPIAHEWVLALDADHRVTPALAAEIARVMAAPAADGYYVPRRQIFRGRWIRHGGYYPVHLLKLFRRGRAWADEREFLDFRFYVQGQVGRLRGDLVEDNRNEADIGFWIDKHNRFATLQAMEELERGRHDPGFLVEPAFFGSPDQRTLWLKRIWYRLPLYVRPFLYFGYRYVLRLGFLDGREGFVFHFLQAFWYRLLVDIKLDELRRGRR